MDTPCYAAISKPNQLDWHKFSPRHARARAHVAAGDEQAEALSRPLSAHEQRSIVQGADWMR